MKSTGDLALEQLRWMAEDEDCSPDEARLLKIHANVLAEELATLRSASAESLSVAARDVLAERKRQITAEGYTLAHDDEHDEGEMALAAACYAASASGYAKGRHPPWWPWAAAFWKPHYDRRDLIRAGALIIAEMERLDRQAACHRVEGSAS